MISDLGFDRIQQLGMRTTEDARRAAVAEDAKNRNHLDQEAFMRLITTQLENQNPMEPQDNSEFVSQMSQFGMLEGIKSLNNEFVDLKSSLTSSQTLQASSMIDKSVFIPADTAHLSEGGVLLVNSELPHAVTNLSFTVTAENGERVYQHSQDVAEAGPHSFVWDGLITKPDGSKAYAKPGEYEINVTGNLKGESIAFNTDVAFDVTSVSLADGGDLQLNLQGHNPVTMNQVKEVRESYLSANNLVLGQLNGIGNILLNAQEAGKNESEDLNLAPIVQDKA